MTINVARLVNQQIAAEHRRIAEIIRSQPERWQDEGETPPIHDLSLWGDNGWQGLSPTKIANWLDAGAP